MIDFDMTDLLLGVVSLLIAVSTFLNTRRKDNRQDGERNGAVTSELYYLRNIMEEVRDETREIRNLVGDHGERIAKCEAKIESALQRIKRLEQHLDIEHEKGA